MDYLSMTFLEKIGHRIRELRRVKGWSQEELADHANLHRTYISSVEQGKRNLAAVNLKGLANAFGMSISEMLKDID